LDGDGAREDAERTEHLLRKVGVVPSSKVPRKSVGLYRNHLVLRGLELLASHEKKSRRILVNGMDKHCTSHGAE